MIRIYISFFFEEIEKKKFKNNLNKKNYSLNEIKLEKF